MNRFKLVVMEHGPSFLVTSEPITRDEFAHLQEVLTENRLIVLSDTTVFEGEGPVVLDVEVSTE